MTCIIDVPLSLTHCSGEVDKVLMKAPGYSLPISTCNLPVLKDRIKPQEV